MREHTSRDFSGTLEGLAQMGYRAVEFAGYGDMTARQMRQTLDRLGMRAMGAHVPYASLESDRESALEQASTLGCEYVVVPSVPQATRSTADGVKRLGETFDGWGEAARARGMRFGYHNHAFEFEPMDGGTMYDLLVASTDPALVAMELDVYWAAYAGRDPLELLRQLGRRARLLHVKDMVEQDGKRIDTPFGEGIMPWQEIVNAADGAGAEWYIVEQDNPNDSLVDVLTSLRNLKLMAQAG